MKCKGLVDGLPCGLSSSCSTECERRDAVAFSGGEDFSFITDRLAIGNVASRAVPGFVAVVSVLATEREGTLCDETAGAPVVPGGAPVELAWASQHEALSLKWSVLKSGEPYNTPIYCIDLADGEYLHSQSVDAHDLGDYLDDAMQFIAHHIARGCVLVHCGVGKSRSVAIVVAYLCRYAGMSLSEALSFVRERRPGACPAPCFVDAIKRWLKLDELASKGPRR